ncbi:TPA: prepilin-type N-terminal cleavage/methylation domain-containing protein, partial [Escherichia coli]
MRRASAGFTLLEMLVA